MAISTCWMESGVTLLSTLRIYVYLQLIFQTLMKFCDIASVVVIPFLSCLIGGWMAATMDFGQSAEVLAIIGSIAVFSTALLQLFYKLFDMSYFSEFAIRSSVLKWLSTVNVMWLVIAVRQMVKVASKKEGITLGATPFGFFLASLVFSCSKFVLYIILYTIELKKCDSISNAGNGDGISKGGSPPTTDPSKDKNDRDADGELRQRIYNKLVRRNETLSQPLLRND